MKKETSTSNYGFSLGNPICVSGFDEERIYMEHLHHAGHPAPVRCRRLGSNISSITNHPIDLYEIAPARFGARRDVLYVDLYGESDWRAPEGFTLDCERPVRENGDFRRALGDELKELIEQFSTKHS